MYWDAKQSYWSRGASLSKSGRRQDVENADASELVPGARQHHHQSSPPDSLTIFAVLHQYTTLPKSRHKQQSCRGDTIPGYVAYTASNSVIANSKQTTIFSPEGRLYQVEYALEAISHAGTALGILAQDGIVLAAERKVTSKLLEQDTSAEKLYILNECVTTLLMFCCVLT
jgi:hypothetical protein